MGRKERGAERKIKSFIKSWVLMFTLWSYIYTGKRFKGGRGHTERKREREKGMERVEGLNNRQIEWEEEREMVGVIWRFMKR